MRSKVRIANRLSSADSFFASSGSSPTSTLTATLSSEPLLLDIKSAARTLSCTVWAVRSLLWSRQIPFIRIGHRFLIDPADLRAYIQRQKEGAA
jgi:excisionase family DNA binding protein